MPTYCCTECSHYDQEIIDQAHIDALAQQASMDAEEEENAMRAWRAEYSRYEGPDEVMR